MEELIKVTQLPVIEERLREVRAAWEQMAADNMALVCTADTLQAVKAARAELTKQYTELDAMRKAAKAQYMERWYAFETTYKECIAEPYKRADADLKGKVDAVESEIKAACEQRCREYFAEICAVHGVDFVRYEQAGVRIDMTSAKQKTPRKLLDQINAWVTGVADGLDCIMHSYEQPERDEIAVEYKSCLDAARAVATVRERHSRIEREKAAAAEREERRKTEAEAVAKVEALAPPKVAQREKLLTVSFKATATREKLIALREWMKQEGIKYE